MMNFHCREQNTGSILSVSAPILLRRIHYKVDKTCSSFKTPPSAKRTQPPWERCTDRWLVLVRCADRPPRLPSRKPRRIQLVVPRSASKCVLEQFVSIISACARTVVRQNRNDCIMYTAINVGIFVWYFHPWCFFRFPHGV